MTNTQIRLLYIKTKYRILSKALMEAIKNPEQVSDPKIIQQIDNLDAEILYNSLCDAGIGELHAEMTLCRILRKDFKTRSLDISRFTDKARVK